MYDKVQNIYDIEGNCWEYVAERNNTDSPINLRGGGYYNYLSRYCSSSSRSSNGGEAVYDRTFRPVLYII